MCLGRSSPGQLLGRSLRAGAWRPRRAPALPLPASRLSRLRAVARPGGRGTLLPRPRSPRRTPSACAFFSPLPGSSGLYAPCPALGCVFHCHPLPHPTFPLRGTCRPLPTRNSATLACSQLVDCGKICLYYPFGYENSRYPTVRIRSRRNLIQEPFRPVSAHQSHPR